MPVTRCTILFAQWSRNPLEIPTANAGSLAIRMFIFAIVDDLHSVFVRKHVRSALQIASPGILHGAWCAFLGKISNNLQSGLTQFVCFLKSPWSPGHADGVLLAWRPRMYPVEVTMRCGIELGDAHAQICLVFGVDVQRQGFPTTRLGGSADGATATTQLK